MCTKACLSRTARSCLPIYEKSCALPWPASEIWFSFIAFRDHRKMTRDPTLFPNPEAFIPERYLEEVDEAGTVKSTHALPHSRTPPHTAARTRTRTHSRAHARTHAHAAATRRFSYFTPRRTPTQYCGHWKYCTVTTLGDVPCPEDHGRLPYMAGHLLYMVCNLPF